MPYKFQLMKNPRWGKSHIKSKTPIMGASLCKLVDDTDKDTKIEDVSKEVPTCMDCRELMVTLTLFSSNLKIPTAIRFTALDYIRYAHTQEKYHKAKIF
jgi:hypothetical protein